jgi:hypothetical protein
VLNISSNKIGHKGMEYLADAFKINKVIIDLPFSFQLKIHVDLFI